MKAYILLDGLGADNKQFVHWLCTDSFVCQSPRLSFSAAHNQAVHCNTNNYMRVNESLYESESVKQQWHIC